MDRRRRFFARFRAHEPSTASGVSSRRRPPSLHGVGGHLGVLVVACLLPAAGIASFALWSSYASGRAELVRKAQIDAHLMSHAVDDAIGRAAVGLQMLATSPSLDKGDLAAFDDQARRSVAYLAGNNIVLSDASGQQRVNTIVPAGHALPRHGNPAFQQEVLHGEAPRVSDLFIGGVLKRPLVVVEVPVRTQGRVDYTLAMGFLPERFAAILAELHPEPDRIISIFDSTGTIVARTHDPARFVGQKGAAALLAALRRLPDGEVETVTLEGVSVIAVYSRSRTTGWSVAIGVPKHLLLARLEREILWLAAAMLGLLAIGFSASGVIARRISGAFRALIEPAAALGEGRPVKAPQVAILEAAEVLRALQTAEDVLNMRTRQLDDAKVVVKGLRENAQHLQHAAHHDALTQLHNRAYLAAALETTIAQARQQGGRFSVLFVDIDNFKPVNDRHGHAVGDQLLQAFASRLLRGIRERDVVARLGGDEFAILIDDHSPAEIAPMAQALVDRLSRPYHVRGLTLEVSASIGAAGYPEDGTTADELLAAADAAMYRIKSRGGRGFLDSGLRPVG
jgi:diguanylate cyclase (GGDEF)-like protein